MKRAYRVTNVSLVGPTRLIGGRPLPGENGRSCGADHNMERPRRRWIERHLIRGILQESITVRI